jgi:outer membrane protein assembly factor BamB
MVLAGLFAPGAGGTAHAQPGTSPAEGRFELAETVQLDRADNVVQGNLERAKAYLAARHWSEAVETVRQVMENSGGMLWGVTPNRYISVREYCHLRLAALPAEALVLYRRRVDPLARKWYEEGIAAHDRQLLGSVVQQALASSWGDRALMALGEMALESGDYAAARGHWERIVPADPQAAPAWLAYPDTHLDLAAVRSRLVLASILEGSLVRARGELAQLAHLHPQARGPLGGHDVNYVEALQTLLAESALWPRPKPSPDWPTFAGSPARNKQAADAADVGVVAWRLRLRRRAGQADAPAVLTSAHAPRGGEDPWAPLSFFPLVVGRWALVANHREILAVDAATGHPAWGGTSPVIYRDQLDENPVLPPVPLNTLGVPRYTLTVHEGKLYARLGSQVTGRPQEARGASPPGGLVCLDLEDQGKLLWKAAPEAGWAFDGAPLCAEGGVYVAMRRSDIRPQAHVACFDAQTGALRWRRFVCAAETPARGMRYESTHNLLTLVRDTLYFNTNLGAVAALAAGDGQVQWISLYPRDRYGDEFHLAPHWGRELTPCLYDRGTLLVAPADSPRILALDAATGQILWQTGPEVDDVVHLLGVAHDRLIASGQRLYWIGLKEAGQGRVQYVWPEGDQGLGYGRGIIAGGRVYWPTRDDIYVFQATSAQQERVIHLRPRGTGGGNLLFAAGRLLVAGPAELVALNVEGRSPPSNYRDVAQTDAGQGLAIADLAAAHDPAAASGRNVILSAAKDLGCPHRDEILRCAQNDKTLHPSGMQPFSFGTGRAQGFQPLAKPGKALCSNPATSNPCDNSAKPTGRSPSSWGG